MRGIAQTLVLSGTVDAGTMSRAVAEFGETPDLERHLVNQRLVTEAQVAQAIAAQTGHEYFDLTDAQLDPSVVAMVPGHLCRKYQVIPIAIRSGAQRPSPRRTAQAMPEHFADELVIGMADPSDIIAIDDIASLTDMVIEPVVVSRGGLAQAFERYIRSDEELSDLSAALEEDAASDLPIFSENIEGQASDAPVVRFVNLLIAQAVNDRASDIHIEPGEHHLTVRYRIDGVLHEMQRADRGIQDGVISRLKIMSAIDIAERRRPQDGRITISHEGRTVDLRVASLPTVWGEKIVMRILDNSAKDLSLADLGMSAVNRERFGQAITRPHGMVLVTGPTGSGKSTTLYASLGEVANPKVNVITVEDPVEFRIPGVNQVQVNHKAGLTFSAALRSILRCDPDIVLVGEIRDQETAITSIEAALTGHLVLSTLHTNDAPSALTRLIEIGAEPYLVGTALSVAVAQRLARRLCERCRQPIPHDPAVLNRLRFSYDPANPPLLYRAVGCSSCANTGYRGRLALQEVMVVTEEIEQLVARNATGTDLRSMAIKQGMVPLRQDGFEKVADGLTTIEEVLRVSL